MAEAEHKTGNKNEKIGEVVSTKMAKTIVVEVSRKVPHPIYKRIINKRKKFYAHDEESLAKPGDIVKIIECRPLSKLKRWTLGEVVRKAVQVGVDPTTIDISPEPKGGINAPAKPAKPESKSGKKKGK